MTPGPLRWVRPVAVLLLAAGLLTPSDVASAATISVSGFVYRDLDNDGVRDPGEPGVPGIRVHRTTGNQTPTTTTGPDGAWTLAGLTSSSSGYLAVESGWFRSQCAALSCAAGPGPDNDFSTSNQFIRYPLAQLTSSTSDLDVGLLPDWPGANAAAPQPVAGVVAANAVDVSARLSWVSSTCPGGKLLICRAGDTYSVSSQIMNQGTVPLTGITAVLDLPPGDRFATGDPTRDVTLATVATSPGISGISVGAIDPATQSVTVDLQGTLPPGGYAKVTADATVVGGPGTAGCVVAAPTSACPTVEPEGAPLTLAVTHIDQAGDPDSFGTDCPPGAPVTTCATGIHDKQVEPDEVDPVGHNVDAALGVGTSYDLSAGVTVLHPAGPGPVDQGSQIVLRALALNTGPLTSPPGWKLTLVLPTATQPVVPAKSALRSCAKGTTSAGYPTITCTGKGPLSPGVASIAMDVALTVPPGTSLLQAVAFVAPAAGQVAETVPAATAPATPSVDTGQSATDNDASVQIGAVSP